MADLEAEEKKIAKLSFDVNDAINNLTRVEKQLDDLSQKSEKSFKNIQSNFDKAFAGGDYSKEISEMQKKMKKYEELNESHQKSISTSLHKQMNKRYTLQLEYNQKSLLQAQKQADAEKNINLQKNAKMEIDNNKHQNKMAEINAKQLKSTQTLADKIQNYAKTYLIYQGFNQLKTEIRETIDEMVELEYQMVQIDRVLSDSSLNIDAYRDKLIQLAYDYGNSFDNVADITLRLAQAGFDAQESLALTEKTLLALNTAELNATQATSDMVAIMAQWGLNTGDATEQAREYGDIIDKINKVADNFPTTSEDILNALKKTSSAFNLAGATIDETIATIVAAETASQRGGKAIGTALSNIIQQLKETKRIEIAEDLGINFYTDATKTQFKNIMDIFQELSQKMQSLKDAGKESSVEMQNLLSIFTVFRRNIGASLLSEMAGEESTYAQVLKASYDSIGYSLQENEKHMKTAKAAQAQFNAELLKLKTQVWDNGLEDTFREFLELGTDLVQGIGNLIDKFGLLPVSIGVVTAAFSLLKTRIKVQDIASLTLKVKDINAQIQKTGKALSSEDKILQGTSKSFKNYVTSVEKGKVSLRGYASNLVTTTVKTALLTAGTIALNAALSFGISAIITGIVSAIDNWINAEEKAIETNKQLMETAKENASQLKNEQDSLKSLSKEYKEFIDTVGTDPKKIIDSDNLTKAYRLQEEINSVIGESGKQVELVTQKTTEQEEAVNVVNTAYEKQISLIKEASYEKQKAQVKELKQAAEAAQKSLELYGERNFWDMMKDDLSGNWTEVNKEIREAGINLNKYVEDLQSYNNGSKKFLDTMMDASKGGIDLDVLLDKANFEEKYDILTNIKNELIETGKTGTNAYSKINEMLDEMNDEYNDTIKAINEYNDSLAELYGMSGQIDSYNTFLDQIYETYESEAPRNLINNLKEINKEFSDGKITIEDYFNKIQEKISEIDFSAEGADLQAYQAIFAATTQSLAEGIESLQAGLNSGTLSFAEYAEGIKEAADNSLELYALQNDLTFNGENWVDASGNINEYANSLAYANGRLAEMQGLLTTIGDNYDYIAEHADASGQAAFNATQVGSEAYNNLALSMTNSLNEMKNNNAMAFDAIVNDIATDMGISANEVVNANGYINEGLFQNSNALNSALNSSANQTGNAVQKVTSAMGNVINALGDAIADFDYKITAGVSGVSWNDFSIDGTNIKFKVPNLNFTIKGEGGSSISNLSSALKDFGSQLTTMSTQTFSYTPKTLKPYTPTTGGGSTTKNSPSSGGSKKSGGGSSNDYDAERAAEEAARAEEEAYKKRLESFKSYIEEKERIEKRWVDKYKELELLTTKDEAYITSQRIKRYEQYLNELAKQTWIKAEDRLELEKTYTEKLQDLQVEYLEFQKDIMDEQIEALQEANEKRIEQIEEEADAQIEALKKVESENDRIRAKEEYLKNRQAHLDDISYWEQRTGREAQEALKEAKANLKELDDEWNKQLEDWSIEDQIAAIEEQRDAQIKAIQETEAAEIEAIKAAYQAKIDLYVQTGQIIYEESAIQSSRLYEVYKSKFIDPITAELNNLTATLAPPAAPAAPAPVQQQYETYVIKSGDNLTKIAKKFGTTIDKILAANPYVTNKNRIYTGKTLQIPKFHEGGIVGGNQEAFALLKPNEVILKTEWAASLNRMMKYFDNLTMNNSSAVSTGPTIEVNGDLIKIEANVRNQNDINNIEKKVEKVLKDKFNIKK